jgi:PhnB protein
MHVQPYLDFNGRGEEALEFYKSALGAKVTFLMRFKECPEPSPSDKNTANANKVMHASLKIGDSTVNVSDGRCTGAPAFKGICLSLGVSNDAEAERMFTALSPGGKVNMPLTKTFFSSKFGMVEDRFGVAWMIVVQP